MSSNDLLEQIRSTNSKKIEESITNFDQIENEKTSKKAKKNIAAGNTSVLDILNKVDEKNKFVTKTSIIAHVPIYISEWICDSARKAGKSKSAYLNSILEEFYKAANGE